MEKSGSKKLFFFIAVVSLIFILPLRAGADPVPWSTQQYKAWAWGWNYGQWVVGRGPVFPVSAHLDFSGTHSSDPFREYAGSEITDSSMFVEAGSYDYPAHASAYAGFTGTFTASLPSFEFSYAYAPQGSESWITVQDTTTSTILLSQSFAGSRTLTVATPLQDEISVNFGLRVDTGVNHPGGTELRSGNLTYNMSVAPEPASSVLFFAGGTVLAGRVFMGRRKKS